MHVVELFNVVIPDTFKDDMHAVELFNVVIPDTFNIHVVVLFKVVVPEIFKFAVTFASDVFIDKYSVELTGSSYLSILWNVAISSVK